MLRRFKVLAGLIAAMAATHEVSAFTIWGPMETWQTAALSYGARFWYSYNAIPPLDLGNSAVTELGGPKNFGEGSRLNTPTITYAFDYSFVSYFGAAGVKAVNSAFAVLNALPAASQASANLTEFLTQGNQQINYTAQALSMLDIKSAVLQIMMEHLGLLGETHVFDMRGLTLLGIVGEPCAAQYQVINRNFDPITWNPTTYVNGVNYTFQIFDGCTAGDAISDAIEVNTDLTDVSSYTAVATYENLRLGGYYLGLTRDDFGGLRYLYNKRNYNYEALAANCYAGSFTSAWAPAETNALSAAWVGVLGGAEKFTFVNVNFNSVFGTNWGTNVIHYTMPSVTNNTLFELDVTRSNTAPDIIFAAADLSASPTDPPFTRTMTFIASQEPLESGTSVAPSVISPTLLVTLNNVGPLYLNYNPGFVDGSTPFLYPYFQWGVYDGTTNAPIAFPTGANLAALEEFVLTQPATAVDTTWNPALTTNTVTAGGTGAGGVGGAGGAGGVGAAVGAGQ
jgi:hypothetical protein